MSAYERKGPRTRMEDLIRKSGLKKGAIAEALRVRPETLSTWLSGKFRIPDDKLEQLVDILKSRGVDASVDEIRAVNGHPKPLGRRPKHTPEDAVKKLPSVYSDEERAHPAHGHPPIYPSDPAASIDVPAVGEGPRSPELRDRRKARRKKRTKKS